MLTLDHSFSHQQPAIASSAKLEPFLMSQPDRSLSNGQLRKQKLAAYAYTVLPETDSRRAQLKSDFVLASMHHLKVRSSLIPLFKAWADADLKALVFKGFFLAEFVYDNPAQRAYGDVDILINPNDAAKAAELARELGWREVWRAGLETDAAPADKISHEVLHLEHPHYPIRLDVHGQVTHVVNSNASVQTQITRAFWQRAEKHSWEGTSVYLPGLADALLVGLVMNRCWSADDWQLKPQDYLDFKVLVAKGLSEPELFDRAKELRCAKTYRLFLERCNPFSQKLDLKQPTAKQRWLWEMQIVFERGMPRLERRFSFISYLVIDSLWALPSFLLALCFFLCPWRLQSFMNLLPLKDKPLYEWQFLRLQRSVRVYLYITGMYWLNPEPLQQLMTFVSLRRIGQPVTMRQIKGERVLKLREERL